jgi:ankyrin repeat protein
MKVSGRSTVVLALVALVAFAAPLAAQNLKDDITNNDLDGLKSKVALLAPDFKAFPYVAYYLRQTKEYQQPMLDYLIAQGASVDQVDDQGVGALYYAIDNDNYEAVKALIANKANVNASWKAVGDVHYPNFFRKDKIAFTNYETKDFSLDAKRDVIIKPLFMAIQSGDTDIVPALLKAGADPLGEMYRLKDLKNSTTQKAVYVSNTVFDYVVGAFAVSQGDLSAVTSPYFANAFRIWQAVKALPVAKQPPVAPALTANLFAYFATGDMKSFKAELVKTGANTLKFLPYAALAENWDIVDIILQYNQIGIDDAFNDSGENLLSWALVNLHTPAATLLLDHAAALPEKIRTPNDYSGSRDWYPLDWAVTNGKPDLVQLLIAHGADVNHASIPLTYAHGNPQIRKLLIDAGADVKATFQYGNSKYLANLLFDAAWKGYPESVSFYLDKGLAPNGVDPEMPPLLAAIKAGKLESISLLLAKGADPRAPLTNSSWFDFNYSLLLHAPKEWAQALADNTSEPLAKSRFNGMVKALVKAESASPVAPLVMDLVRVDGGTFTMGGNNYYGNPRHDVTVSGFLMSKKQITQIEFLKATGKYPERTDGSSNPLELTFVQAAAFCNSLSANEHLDPVYSINGTTVTADKDANGYRLPTEAEWEYAATRDPAIAGILGLVSDRGEMVWDPWADNGNKPQTDPGWDKRNSDNRTFRGQRTVDFRVATSSGSPNNFRVVRNMAP